MTELKSRIQNRLIAELDPRMDLSNAGGSPPYGRRHVYIGLEAEAIVLTRVERLRLFEAIAPRFWVTARSSRF